jgi:hypothetical protein
MKSSRVVAKAIACVVALTIAVGSVAVTEAGATGRSTNFPSHIDLPNGFRPEGIAIKGKSFFVGSLGTGAIYRGDLRTGIGAVIYPGDTGPSVGLAVDQNGRVFAAGGNAGNARVVDGKTGQLIKVIPLTTATTFINDVVITQDSAWFTDSLNPVLYRVPLDLVGQVQTVPLTGDITYAAGFNVNGIDATADGKTLILVQSNAGKLFTSDLTGTTKQIVLTSGAGQAESVPFGDGILLEGRTLYVVQNQLNVIAVIKLDERLTSGTVVKRLENPDLDVPTTIDRFDGHLYAVSARFSTTPTPETKYWITAVPAGHGKRSHHGKH